MECSRFFSRDQWNNQGTETTKSGHCSAGIGENVTTFIKEYLLLLIDNLENS